ncbi:bud neck involved protein, partial [Modicella reniformis]
FSTKEPVVFPTWAPEQYDRTSDTNITATRLTPAIAQKIKLELNQFKGQEMEVHQDSRVYTHFFI